MEKDQVYFRTKSGEQALAEPMRLLQHNLRRALALVDGRSTVAQIHARFGDEGVAGAALADLLRSGLIAASGGNDGPGPAVRAAPRREAIPIPSVPPMPPPMRTAPASSLIEEISLQGDDDLTEEEFDLQEPLAAPGAFGAGGQFGVPLQIPGGRPKPAPVRRRWRLSVNWPLLAAILVVGLVAGLTALVVFFPYARYKPEVEVRLAEFLHQPVKIGGMRVTLTPRPNLTLEQVEIGPRAEVRIASAKLIPGVMSLIHRGGVEFGAHLDGVDLGMPGLELLARGRSQGPVARPAWHIGYTTVSGLNLSLGTLRLSRLLADISVGAGGVENINLRNEDQNFRVSVAGEGDGFRLAGTALDWKAGGFPVRSLDLAGVVNASRISLSRVEGSVLHGLASGSLEMDWNGGLRGDVSLTRVDAGQLWSALEVDIPVRGELTGRFHVEGSHVDVAGLLARAGIEGDVRLARGQVERMDLGGAVRNGNGSAVRGGMTGFDELAVSVRRDGQTWRLSNLRMAAGSMQAAGDLVLLDNGALGGSLTVNLADKVRTPVNFSGTLKEPVLRGQRGG